jgi:hypothetical protein
MAKVTLTRREAGVGRRCRVPMRTLRAAGHRLGATSSTFRRRVSARRCTSLTARPCLRRRGRSPPRSGQRRGAGRQPADGASRGVVRNILWRADRLIQSPQARPTVAERERSHDGEQACAGPRITRPCVDDELGKRVTSWSRRCGQKIMVGTHCRIPQEHVELLLPRVARPWCAARGPSPR